MPPHIFLAVRHYMKGSHLMAQPKNNRTRRATTTTGRVSTTGRPRTAMKAVESNRDVDDVVDNTDLGDMYGKYQEYEDRARKFGIRTRAHINLDPYVLDDEYFNPPLEVPVLDIKRRMIITENMNNNQVLNALRIIFRGEIDRFLDTISKIEQEQGVDGDAVVTAIIAEILEHNYGPEALDAIFPGASV